MTLFGYRLTSLSRQALDDAEARELAGEYDSEPERDLGYLEARVNTMQHVLEERIAVQHVLEERIAVLEHRVSRLSRRLRRRPYRPQR